MSDKIIHLKSMVAHDELIANNPDKVIVIDFHATWCGPCHQIAPKYEALANSVQECIFTKVDVDEAEDIARHYKISAMPTFKVIQSGEEIDSVRGANPQALETMLLKYKA
ncbi:hypothetical protein ACGC1H_007469 [Rhizoctonia solani]